MTKADLIDQIAAKRGAPRSETSKIVNGLIDAICRALIDGNHIEIRKFGTFKVRERRARIARNPRSGETVEVPAKLVPHFKASRELRDGVADQLGDGGFDGAQPSPGALSESSRG
jgi:nucleoid DNA-binding protein